MVGERETGTEVYLEITGVMLTLSGACMRMGRGRVCYKINLASAHLKRVEAEL